MKILQFNHHFYPHILKESRICELEKIPSGMSIVFSHNTKLFFLFFGVGVRSLYNNCICSKYCSKFAFLFHCMPAGLTSDSMTVPT